MCMTAGDIVWLAICLANVVLSEWIGGLRLRLRLIKPEHLQRDIVYGRVVGVIMLALWVVLRLPALVK